MDFLSDEEIAELKPKMMIMQIIVGALIGGVTFFLCIALFLKGGPSVWDPAAVFAIIGLAIAGMLIIGSFVFPIISRRSSGSESSKTADAALMHLQTETIIRGAIVEGGAFMNIVMFFVEGNGFNLLAALACLAALLLLFPTRGRLVAAIESLRQ